MWSVPGCLNQVWQYVVRLWLFESGMAVYGRSVTICLNLVWQYVVCLRLLESGMAVCGL